MLKFFKIVMVCGGVLVSNAIGMSQENCRIDMPTSPTFENVMEWCPYQLSDCSKGDEVDADKAFSVAMCCVALGGDVLAGDAKVYVVQKRETERNNSSERALKHLLFGHSIKYSYHFEVSECARNLMSKYNLSEAMLARKSAEKTAISNMSDNIKKTKNFYELDSERCRMNLDKNPQCSKYECRLQENIEFLSQLEGVDDFLFACGYAESMYNYLLNVDRTKFQVVMSSFLDFVCQWIMQYTE